MQYNNEIGSVSFRLKDPKLETSRIAGRYSFKDYQIDFSTGIKIPTIHWDKNKQCVSSGTSKKEINLKLDKFRASIIDTHNRFNEQYNRIPTKEELKSIVNSAKEGKDIKVVKKGKKSFDDIFEEFMEILKLKNNNAIDSGQKPKHKSYISSFNVMYKDLKEFAKETNTFIDIDKFDKREMLNNSLYDFNIETNGTIIPSFHRDNVWFTYDYKTPSSLAEESMNIDIFKVATERDLIKFVVGSPEDLDCMRRIIDQYPTAAQIYVSPVWGQIEAVLIIDYMKAYNLQNVRFQLQIHKFVWDPDAKGV